MALLRVEINRIIKARLPETFDLIIDGLFDASYHFPGKFAIFCEGEWDKVVESLLSCNIVEDVDKETDFDMNLPEKFKTVRFYRC